MAAFKLSASLEEHEDDVCVSPGGMASHNRTNDVFLKSLGSRSCFS